MRKISSLVARGGMGCWQNNPEAELKGPGGSLFSARVRPFSEPGGNSIRAQIIQYFELIEGRRWQSYGRT
jgi:hypothetical protein